MTVFLSEDSMFFTATDRPMRPLPAGCDQQGRHLTRGSADPLGEDCAERHSAWGHLPDCAAEGGQFREPSGTVRPGLLARLLRRLGF